MKSLSRARLLVTPWTAAYQAPPSIGFSRQEYWSGVPLPSGSIQEEDITIVNIYAPNIGAPQYISQELTNIKGETDSNTS